MARQLVFFATLLIIAFAGSLGFAFAQDRSSGQRLLRVRESKPVTVNDARFVTVVETQWQACEDPVNRRPTPVEARLRITNLKKTALVFATNGTFVLTIKDKDGKEITGEYAIDSERIPRPILLPGGASFSIVRRALLTWDPITKASTLGYGDGTGAWWTYGPLHSGKYKVSFLYSTTRFPNPRLTGLIDNVPVWLGEAQTPEVSIEVINPRPEVKE